MGVNKENTAHGTVPEYGAIFMSNSTTRKECFRRKIFGLPSWLGDFVLQIKSGTILFLFEYENRVLHGVFRATSDGAMNVVPHAYSSSGQQFPAQVKFSIMWCCNPLSEGQFQNAIKENYFSAKKFNFGLSKVQVHRLLSLFSLTKFSDQLHRRQLSSDSFECSSDYLIDESQSVADVNGLILKGRLQGELMEGEVVNTTQEGATLTRYDIRNIIPSTENSIHHYSHMDNRNSTYDSGSQSNAQIMMPSLQNQSVADVNGLLLEGRLRGKLMEGKDQINTMQESVTLPHYDIRNIISSPENPIHYSHMDNRNLTYDSGSRSNAQIMMPSLQSQSDCMTCMPFQTSVYLENITVPSVTQCHINVSCSDPNLRSLPKFETEGSSRRAIITSEYPSHGLNYSIFSYQNEQGLARQGSTEEYNMYFPEVKEFPIQLPFDSVRISSRPSIEQTAANHGHERYGNSGSIHSDRERNGSVFSRLTYPSDTTIQDFNDYADHDKLFLDPSMDEVMSGLQRHHCQWEKTNCKVVSQEQNIGRNFVKKKRAKSSSSLYSNCFQVSELRTNIEDGIDDNGNHVAIGIPFVNFKRRRKPCNVEDNTPTGGENVIVGSVQLSSVQRKRRKLIRPSFACNELCESGDINSGSPSLRGTLKDSLLRERASSDPKIEIDKTEKLCQVAEFPDIISLVDDEKNIGGETVATVKDCCGSTKNCSEDRTVFSNYISGLNIISKGVNEGCSSTHECSTSEDHMACHNMNNSGLCSEQEFSLEEGFELNAANRFIRFNEGGNQCNEKVLVKRTKTVDEPYQGYAALTESSVESSTPLDSASESVPEEVTERRKQDNEMSSGDLN